MLKNILLSGLFCASLSAESFDEFLRQAMLNSPYLKSSALAVEQAKQQGSTLKRYTNPSLELEYSEFDPEVGESENGYRVNFSQPIRLWSVGNDKDAVAQTMKNKAGASYTQERAEFQRSLSLQFSAYAQQKMLTVLGKEELAIAKKIYDISKARYESGTISRGLMLQAKVDYEMIQINNESLNLRAVQAYYALLKRAGLTQEITLETDYIFIISNLGFNNPDLALLQKEQELSVSQTKLNSNSVEWVNVVVEYENEPDQEMFRAGVNFPLAIFNTKSQEREISKLQASRTELILENETKRLAIDTKRLLKERQSLNDLQARNET